MKKVFAFTVCVFPLLCFLNCQPRAEKLNTEQFEHANVIIDPVMKFTEDETSENTVEVKIMEPYTPKVFELPVIGATGIAGTRLPLYLVPGENAFIVDYLGAGRGFTILDEIKDWWYIVTGNTAGWVMNSLCLINIPDIIPSIVHDNTNTYSSLFRSSWVDIPNVTGLALYKAKDFNRRLGREEYITPVLYGMAEKLYIAQQNAVANGHTIIIYEAFRPHDAHQIVFNNLSELIKTDPYVLEGLTSSWYTLNWFLAPSPYNHQRGTAVDASLGIIIDKKIIKTGAYEYTHVASFSEFTMQTPIHELSGAAAIFTAPVFSRDDVSWRSAVFCDYVTEGTRLLFNYMTGAGLTPLASEWWHFNDLINTDIAVANNINGRFQIEKSYSVPVN